MLQKAKAKCKSSGGTLCQCRSTQNYTDPATAPENLLSGLRLGFIFLFLSFFAHDNLKRNPGGTRKPFKVRMKSATGKIGVRLPLSTACIDQAAARGDPGERGERGELGNLETETTGARLAIAWAMKGKRRQE